MLCTAQTVGWCAHRAADKLGQRMMTSFSDTYHSTIPTTSKPSTLQPSQTIHPLHHAAVASSSSGNAKKRWRKKRGKPMASGWWWMKEEETKKDFIQSADVDGVCAMWCLIGCIWEKTIFRTHTHTHTDRDGRTSSEMVVRVRGPFGR